MLKNLVLFIVSITDFKKEREKMIQVRNEEGKKPQVTVKPYSMKGK